MRHECPMNYGQTWQIVEFKDVDFHEKYVRNLSTQFLSRIGTNNDHLPRCSKMTADGLTNQFQSHCASIFERIQQVTCLAPTILTVGVP